MPIIKSNEPLPEGPVVIGIYGDPGASKTTIANTAEKVLLCDFDRGSRRSLFRKDTLVLTSWNDVVEEETKGTFKGYKTIVIDTAKAALDDFLMSYVIEKDFTMRKNKLKAYGAIGDEFKLFLNTRRNEGADVIIIAHAKKDEDTKRHIPDITGQSYQLMLRVCDEIGYVSMINNKRTIQFDPTDVTIGKNTAQLPMMEIPDKADPAIRTFMADIIKKVREAMTRQSEEQVEAMNKSEEFQKEIYACETPDCLTELLEKVHQLPEYLKLPLQKIIGAKAKEKGYIANKETKRFELPPAQSDAGKQPAATPGAAQPNGEKKDDVIPTSLDDRCKTLEKLGLQIQIDGAGGFGLFFTFDMLKDMTEEQFHDIVSEVNAKKEATKKTSGKRNKAA